LIELTQFQQRKSQVFDNKWSDYKWAIIGQIFIKMNLYLIDAIFWICRLYWILKWGFVIFVWGEEYAHIFVKIYQNEKRIINICHYFFVILIVVFHYLFYLIFFSNCGHCQFSLILMYFLIYSYWLINQNNFFIILYLLIYHSQVWQMLYFMKLSFLFMFLFYLMIWLPMVKKIIVSLIKYLQIMKEEFRFLRLIVSYRYI
jgi:hypothetical protein